ncbi:hypothetical protein ACQCVP_12925 [Rossellomorea vietnamensis]
MPVGADQGASTFYTGEAEEAHRTPRGVTHLEWKSVAIVFRSNYSNSSVAI